MRSAMPAVLVGALRVALASAGLAFGAPFVPQQAREAEALSGEMELLGRRERGALHAALPVTLQGRAADPEAVLGETPALAGVHLAAVLVDTGELRERKLALYEGGARFDRPPTRAAAVEEREPRPGRPRTPAREGEGTEGERSSRSGAILLGCAVLGALAYGGWRMRRCRVTGHESRRA